MLLSSSVQYDGTVLWKQWIVLLMFVGNLQVVNDPTSQLLVQAQQLAQQQAAQQLAAQQMAHQQAYLVGFPPALRPTSPPVLSPVLQTDPLGLTVSFERMHIEVGVVGLRLVET